MDEKKEQHWEKYRQPKTQKSKLCCYLYGLCDIVCFVLGAYLLSLAIFSNCTAVACSTCCGCFGLLGLPLIALGFVIRSWRCKYCCSSFECGDNKSV